MLNDAGYLDALHPGTFPPGRSRDPISLSEGMQPDLPRGQLLNVPDIVRKPHHSPYLCKVPHYIFRRDTFERDDRLDGGSTAGTPSMDWPYHVNQSYNKYKTG